MKPKSKSCVYDNDEISIDFSKIGDLWVKMFSKCGVCGVCGNVIYVDIDGLFLLQSNIYICYPNKGCQRRLKEVYNCWDKLQKRCVLREAKCYKKQTKRRCGLVWNTSQSVHTLKFNSTSLTNF